VHVAARAFNAAAHAHQNLTSLAIAGSVAGAQQKAA
jgi:hypothetical protein